mgnify:CR=1 FL=1
MNNIFTLPTPYFLNPNYVPDWALTVPQTSSIVANTTSVDGDWDAVVKAVMEIEDYYIYLSAGLLLIAVDAMIDNLEFRN